MDLLRHQIDKKTGQVEISKQRRMPVNDSITANVQTVPGETVQLQYYNSGVLTNDAGQAAGTVVVANLTNKNILNALGDVVGSYGDTSFSFGTGTILTTLRPFREMLAEKEERDSDNELLTGASRAKAVTDGFRNGDYCIDHENGVIYGKKATTGTSDTGTYKVLVSGGGGSVSENVNIAKIGGTATAAAAALADNVSNPTVGSFGAYLSGYDGGAAQWDRIRASGVDADASLAQTQGVLNVLGHNYVFNGTSWDRLRSAQVSNSTTVTGFQNSIPAARYNAAPTARTEDQFGPIQADANGSLNTNPGALSSSTDSVTVYHGASATVIGCTPYFNSALSNTAVSIKASAGNVHGWDLYNSNATVHFVQVFNVASGSVTLGTTTPFYSIAVPTGSRSMNHTVPVTHNTAISAACTATATGNGAPAAANNANFFYV